MKIIVNKIQCLHCNDIIESKNVQDYKRCKCGKVLISGGHNCLDRDFPSYPADIHYKDLSHYIDDDGEEIKND